ncbi:MAG TPA: acyltransferase family protein [Trichormus sp.]
MKLAVKPERNVVVVPESMQQAMARLLFIDGLRALAICIVVFNHAWSWTNHNSVYVTRVLGGSIEFLFVISGFCLFLPMVRDEHQAVRALDLKRYVRRRFARIYPSYLAGLALSVGALYLAYKFGYHASYVNYADLFPWSAQSWQSILAHLTMTHALFPQFCFSINFSYWVLSIEWQFYLLFPILMFVAKRFSLKAALIVPFAVAIMSQVGLWAGLHTAVPLRDLASCLQYYVEGVETEGLLEIVTGHAHAPGGYAWVFPKGHGMAEVGLGVVRTLTKHDARWHLDKFMQESFLAPRFQNARIVEIQGGGVPLARALKQPYADNVLLVGDAARQVNPLTGGGIHTALRSAKMAGEFIASSFKQGAHFDAQLFARYHMEWFAQLGAPLSDLYDLKRDIFAEKDLEQQSKLLFDTLGNYFQPHSEFRKT